MPDLAPSSLPDMAWFDQQKALIFNRLYGDPLPSNTGGAEFGTGAYGQNQRDIQAYGRGQADPTLSNISKAIGFGLGMGPSTPFTMAAGAGLNAAFGTDTGIGLPSFTGFIGPRPGGLPPGMTLAQAQAADRVANRVSRAGQFTGRGYGGPSSRGGGGGRGSGPAEHGFGSGHGEKV